MDPGAIALFRELADRSPSEREDYYARHHVPAALRADVESLLRFDGEAVDSLDGYVASAAERVLLRHPGVAGLDQRESTAAGPVETIGPYRLFHRLGEGGMGEVWLADQTRPLHRQVALKIIKAGMDTAQVVARFDAERQALALMSHPAIAQVFDAGATRQGRPFFAMEYVRGEPITTYCNRHRLTTRQRIDLFIEVCEGVQHAHQKGIIHRDLKPSNILVAERNGSAVPKIIDFGLAKAMTLSLTERTLYTEFGAFLGTPEYISPEQADIGSIDVDTRSDVYALGVILYELLTGALPFDGNQLRQKPLTELRRTIREVEPPRPSTRVSTLAADGLQSQRPDVGTIAGELRGDLDWITMRALEKECARRYGSVSDLAADLRRHLEHHPVAASPPSALYRIRKFTRRHRAGVTAAVLVFALVFAFAGTMTFQARRIERERDRANVEAATAKQVSDFLASLFSVSNPSEARGNSLTAREVLDNGARRIEKELAGQPEIQGRLMALIGDVYSSLGLYAQAESSLQRSLQIRRGILGRESADTLASVNKLGVVFATQGKLTEAEPLFREALELRRRVLGPDHPDTLRSIANMAGLLQLSGDYKEATVYAQEALDIRRRTLGEDAPDTIDAMNNFGNLLAQEGNLVDAEKYIREALTRSRRVRGPDHPRTLVFMRGLSDTLSRRDQYHEAEMVFREALDIQRRVLGTDHPETLRTRSQLATTLHRQGKLTEAELEYTDTLARQQRGDTPRRNLSSTMLGLGALRLDQARHQEAETLGRQSLELAESNFTLRTDAMQLIGHALLSQRRFADAESFLLGSYAANARNEQRHKERETLALILNLYEDWQRPDKAAEWRARLSKLSTSSSELARPPSDPQ